jgi:hypothetical protein
MKKTLLTLFSICLLTHLYAQKFELSVQANSGLFHYSGNSAVSASYINEGETARQNYTTDPYGNKNGFSYGGDIQAQYVNKSGLLAGVQAGYDVLRSKVVITKYYPFSIILFNVATPGYYDYFNIPVNGQTYLEDKSINISPYIGYRLKIKKIKIDLMPGIDLGFNINSYEKGKATATDGTTYQTNLKMPKAPTDVRLKFGIAATYNRFGITASFAHGLTN